MPVLPVTTLQSPPTNCFGLVQYLQQRLPGYDPSEYLREINSAYVHVWEEVTKLKNHYFTNIKTVTVSKAQTTYDLMFNADGGLSAPISNRFYQATRIRIQSSNGGLFQNTEARSPQDPEFISLSANPAQLPSTTGPYYWHPYGRGSVNFALPLSIGSTIEVIYTFWLVAMTFVGAGTVSSAGNAVTGTGSNFTSIVQPDFQLTLPTTQAQEEIQAELVCNTSQIYRVLTVPSATSLTTATAVAPVLAGGSQYILGTLPEIPREHIRVIASLAMAKMYSIAGDDARVNEWNALSERNMQMMKDSLVDRQSNNPAKRIRFPGSIAKARNRTFLR